ncbi:unnamed protein product [Pleuronectes platessa]|uniref:Uncharacterized protein n=1 Tax=Pleuronectes platessa TaxID=8262 RepID=A0A9N7TIS4_PLEPL|nr:unnamed protein product [Pleuronectes platessa]
MAPSSMILLLIKCLHLPLVAICSTAHNPRLLHVPHPGASSQIDSNNSNSAKREAAQLSSVQLTGSKPSALQSGYRDWLLELQRIHAAFTNKLRTPAHSTPRSFVIAADQQPSFSAALGIPVSGEAAGDTLCSGGKVAGLFE